MDVEYERSCRRGWLGRSGVDLFQLSVVELGQEAFFPQRFRVGLLQAALPAQPAGCGHLG